MKAAMVGCGAISDIFFKNFTERFKIIDLVKCCSKGGASAEAKAKQYGLEKSTLEEILADPEIELIVNATPAMQHYDIIKSALEAGKHVFTEKVITPDFRQAQELQGLARKKGLYLCSEPDHFLGSAWQCAREYIDGGILGDVTSIIASASQNQGGLMDTLRFASEPGGGPGFDYCIYLVTQMVGLFGPVAEVCGVMKTNVPKRVHRRITLKEFGQSYDCVNEDLVSATLVFQNGAVANIHMNANSILEAPSPFMIFGTNGVLAMPMPSQFSGDVKLYRQSAFDPVSVVPVHGFDHDSRGVGAAEMAWAIRLGKTPRAEAALGIHCLEICQGIKESSETRTFYKMTTTCDKPASLPKGYRGFPMFYYDEESSLIFED